jgi:hypothetical protein
MKRTRESANSIWARVKFLLKLEVGYMNATYSANRREKLLQKHKYAI